MILWRTLKELTYPKPMLEEGNYKVQTLCNALWYLTNQHITINDAALQNKDVYPIPTVSDSYQGYNEVKRKKKKSHPLECSALQSNAEALYSILLKPSTRGNKWVDARQEIEELANSMASYSKHLQNQLKHMNKIHESMAPAKTVAKDATIQHIHSCSESTLKLKYKILDKAVTDYSNTSPEEPLIFDETLHLESPFESSLEKFRFFEGLQLTVPIDLIRFSPGGSAYTTFCIRKVPETRSESEMLIQGAQMILKSRPYLLEFHTRKQKRIFRDKLKTISNISPAIVNFIYKELALDGSADANPVVQERLRLISLGYTGLVTDLRHLNPGRPGNTYDTFFDKMADTVEQITAADDRRHGTCHLSEFISLDEMIAKTKEACPPGTKVPSKDLVRLQFTPTNPYTHRALNFTSKIKVQYKVQRRQLRVTHIDAHFCNAQFRYLKELAVTIRDDCFLICCDDKAKVPIGEPGTAVSTGVRGKRSLVPTSTTLVALDHDMTKASITPSFILQVKIPENCDKSFVAGKVFTAVNDSVFQMSNPFRHAAMVVKTNETPKPILLKFTDGGTDQRNTLESVRCASICLFKELNLDMLIHCRCAPGQSYTNPAERVMSILSLGLQNVSLERKELEENVERKIRSCNSMAAIRTLAEEKPEIKHAWTETMEPVQSLIRNRFMRLKLKDEPVRAIDPVSDAEIDILKRHLRELFPEMNLEKLQKVHTKKVKSYQDWIEKHCKMSHYAFQIRKCEDRNCCLEPTVSREKLNWLPDLVLQDNGEHYKPYAELKDTETDEKDRPSFKGEKEKANKQKKTLQAATDKLPGDTTIPCNSANEVIDVDNTTDQGSIVETGKDTEIEMPVSDPALCTVQYARSVCQCVECEKPRVVYSRHRLTERQQVSLLLHLSECEYSCGSALFPPSNAMSKKVMCRSNLTCSMPIELAYYSSGLGNTDMCCYCCDVGHVNPELKAKFKTVYPICDDCLKDGKKPITQRPYGKQ